MVISQETILDFVKRNGPLLPSQLAKAIKSDIIIASAHLSNLAGEKKVKISNTKVGGSPLYYVSGQESRLIEFTDDLDEKDQQTITTLEGKKLLRDDILDKLTRVSLRKIKDFAVPLQVVKGNERLLFWKWHLLPNKDAEDMIREELEPKEESMDKQKEQEQEELIKKRAEEELMREEEEQKKKEEMLRKREEQKKAEQERADTEKKSAEEKRRIEEERREIDDEKKKLEQERQKMQRQFEMERQTMLKEMEKQKTVKKKETVQKKEEDEFLQHLTGYFNDKKIKVLEYKIIRKKAEIDLVLKVPSVVGELEYYCKAKNKKTISDTDLSSAVVQGQLKKLPVLLLSTGELTRKAKELMATELQKGIVVKKI